MELADFAPLSVSLPIDGGQCIRVFHQGTDGNLWVQSIMSDGSPQSDICLWPYGSIPSPGATSGSEIQFATNWGGSGMIINSITPQGITQDWSNAAGLDMQGGPSILPLPSPSPLFDCVYSGTNPDNVMWSYLQQIDGGWKTSVEAVGRPSFTRFQGWNVISVRSLNGGVDIFKNYDLSDENYLKFSSIDSIPVVFSPGSVVKDSLLWLFVVTEDNLISAYTFDGSKSKFKCQSSIRAGSSVSPVVFNGNIWLFYQGCDGNSQPDQTLRYMVFANNEFADTDNQFNNTGMADDPCAVLQDTQI